MSEHEQNRSAGRIPARAMYNGEGQRAGQQELTRRGDRVRPQIQGEAAPRYAPAQAQYVSKRVSRSPQELEGEPGMSPDTAAPQAYQRSRRSQRHGAQEMAEPQRDLREPAPPRVSPIPRQGADNAHLLGQGRPPVPGANYARAPRPEEFAPARARQPQPVPAYLEEEDDTPRRGRAGLTFLLLLLFAGALFLGGLYFLLPPRDPLQNGGIINTLNDVKDSITREAGVFAQSVKAVVAPEAKEAPQVQDFQVVPSSAQAPVELSFTITTTKTVQAVRVADEQGKTLGEAKTPRVEEARTIWTLNVSMAGAYAGKASAHMLTEGGWMDSGKTVQLNIAAPVSLPAASPEPPGPTEPAPVETPEPEPSWQPDETAAPTAPPTQAPTAPPTQAPTPTPTPVPTPSPTPGPTPMPYMAAGATQGTDPSKLGLTTRIYNGTKTVNEYARQALVKLGEPDGYAAWSGAVLTFRGGPFRQNAAHGTVEVAENRLEVRWSVPMGGISSYHGAGWTGQPAIVKWPKEIRELMNLNAEKKAVSALKEVILASQDGKIYFLDLVDGKATRDPINVGYPLKGSVSVNPRGVPMLTVGQGISIIGGKTGPIGHRLFNLIDQKQLNLLDGRDKRAYGTNGAFDGTALFDRSNNQDTVIVAGENGLLYTVALNTQFDLAAGKLTVDPQVVAYKSKAAKRKDNQTGVEGSVAMYGSYAYFADSTGILQCVDVNTMTAVWAVDTGDNTDATIALDFDEDGALGLYTGNTVKEQGRKGVCTIRRLNALTGVQEWVYTVEVAYNKDEPGGVMASPLVGKHSIGNLVIFTVAKTSEGGQMIAFDKKTGQVVWQQDMAHFSYSSPIAVYNEAGGAWIIQGDSAGVLQLMDGQTGVVMNSIQLEGAIVASPAAYGDMLVIGTSGKGVSKIYGINIR